MNDGLTVDICAGENPKGDVSLGIRPRPATFVAFGLEVFIVLMILK